MNTVRAVRLSAGLVETKFGLELELNDDVTPAEVRGLAAHQGVATMTVTTAEGTRISAVRTAAGCFAPDPATRTVPPAPLIHRVAMNLKNHIEEGQRETLYDSRCRHATVGRLGMRAVLDALQSSLLGLSTSAAFGADGLAAELQMTRADLAAELLGKTGRSPEPSRARGAAAAATGDDDSGSGESDSGSGSEGGMMAAYRNGSIIDEISDGLSDDIGSDSDAGIPAPISRVMTDDVQDECTFASDSEASAASSSAARRRGTADGLAKTRWRKGSMPGSTGGSSVASSIHTEAAGETAGRDRGGGRGPTSSSKRTQKKTAVKKTFNAIYGASVSFSPRTKQQPVHRL